MFKFVCWILACEVVFGVSCKSHNLWGNYHPGDESIPESVPAHQEIPNRVKRGFSTVGTNSLGTKFIEVSSKIKDVVNKIRPGDEIWKDFDRVFRDINENYNTFHDNGNEIGESPIRRAISESFLPVTTVMSEFELIMCDMGEYADEDEPLYDVTRFIEDFQAMRAEVKKLSAPDLMAQATKMGMNSTFTDLKNLKTPTGNLIVTSLKGVPDTSVHQYLLSRNICSLADGTFMYLSRAVFTIDLLSYFADGFYDSGDVEQYNKFFELVTSSYSDALKALVGKDSGDSLIQQVLSTLQVLHKKLPGDMKEEAELLSKKMEFLKQIQSHLESVELPLILDVPEKLTGKLDFEDLPIKTPIGHWQDGANVSYAVQYRHKNMYSRLGEWMEPITVSGEANPTLRLKVHPKRFDRLVFRKFNNQKPQLAGALEDKYQTEFRDVNRDLYDAASRFDKKSTEDAEILINNGADINAVFEGGRRAIHAAAQSDNVELAKKFLIKTGNNKEDDCGVNAKDHKGYTPLHVASENGHRRFIKLLLENGGDVNAKTHLKQWTPLHIAAGGGFVSMVKTLLKSQVIDVNAREKGGFSPVHRAVSGGIPVLEVLMADNRTDVQAKTDMGLNPLILAIIEEYDDITGALLATGKVDINYKTNTNMTALAFASILGNTDIMQSLLKIADVDVNVDTIDKWKPIHLAMAIKNDDAIKTLLSINQTDVDASTSSKITPLHIAVVTEQKDITEQLIKRGVKIDAQTTSGLAPIHLALLYKKYEIFNVLVDGGADIQAKASDGSSLLHFAINNNKFDVIESLVKKGVDINAKNIITGETPLHTATKLGYLEVIKILVQHGVDVNVENKEGETPLHYVPYLPDDKRVDILDLLTSNGADVDARDKMGRTPLHLAVQLGFSTSVTDLIRNGAEVNAKDYLGRTPLHMATRNSAVVTNFLLGNNADVQAVDIAGQTPLHIAVKDGNANTVRNLLAKGASMKIADHNYQTPVHLAVVHNRLDILSLMGDQQSNVFSEIINIPYEHYPNLNSPLHLATVLGRIDMLDYIQQRVIINQELWISLFDTAASSGKLDALKNLFRSYSVDIRYLSSSVCLAAKYGHSDIVEQILNRWQYYTSEIENPAVCCVQSDSDVLELLINKGESVNVQCPDGRTPLQKAAQSGNINVVKALIKHIYHDTDIGNQKLLQILVQNGNMNEVKNQIDRGVMVNETALEGITLLHIMSQSGNLTEVKSLVDRGIPVNSATDKLETPLHFAARGRNKDIISYLVDNNADVNAKDYTGKTPLHWSLDAQLADLSVVESLVDHGAQLNLSCLQGKTPLHMAVQGYGSLNIVRYLLSKNVDVNARDNEGNTPLFDAVRSGNLDIIKSLVEGGADVRIVNRRLVGPLHYLTFIQNGAIPSTNDFSSQTFKHVSQPAMDILHYLISKGVKV